MSPSRRGAAQLLPSVVGWTLLCVLPPLVLLGHWDTWSHWSVLGRWAFIERYDLRCYYDASSAFANGAGIFGNLRNEYPLAANLLFDVVGAASRLMHPLPDPFEAFVWTWVSLMWGVYLGVLALLSRRGAGIAPLLWLTPAAFHFTLLRFDAWPMLATLLALYKLEEDRITPASLWFGLAVALKGYPIVLLPSYAVLVLSRRTWHRAFLECGFVLVPFALANLVVFVMAGRESMEAPYKLLALHHLNGESAWDALHYLTGADVHAWLARWPTLPKWGVLAAGILPALSWPGEFDEFVEAGFAAILGSILVLDFQSPQYILWALPFAAMSRRQVSQWLFVVHEWAIFFYFPILFERRFRHTHIWHYSIEFAHLTRLVVLGEVVRGLLQRRRRPSGLPIARL